MKKIYKIKGCNVIILERATATEIKLKEIKKGYVIIQDLKTGLTGVIEKNKLNFKRAWI